MRELHHAPERQTGRATQVVSIGSAQNDPEKEARLCGVADTTRDIATTR